ncbi:MAG: MBL fold metallo-hydrolase [Planctomycetaceae bacterium]
MHPRKASLTALGVAGAPAPERLTTTFLLPGGVAVDSGALAHALQPSARRQVTDLLLTHAHLDHTLGIPFLLAGQTLTIWGLAETLRAVRENLLDGRIWPDLSTYAVWRPVTPGRPFRVGPYDVEAGFMTHTTDCVGYAFAGDSVSCVIAGDTRLEQEVVAWAAARHPTVCVVECSMPDERAEQAHRYGHQTPRDLAAWRDALGGETRLLVTHLKPDLEAPVREQCAALRDPSLAILRDGDVVEL